MFLKNQSTNQDLQESYNINLPHDRIGHYDWGVLTPGHVNKTWGYETIHINTGLYCLKELHIWAGAKTSKHFHIMKHETLLCTRGKIAVLLYNKDSEDAVVLEEGDAFVVAPGLVHSLYAVESDSVLIEASTFSRDEDSIRLK